MSDTFKLNIDGQEIDVPKHYTLMQACEEAGAEIPRFCYHERLSVAGNCRMCLVEWEGAPKPIASCAQIVGDMRPNRDGSAPNVRTKGAYIEKARNGVMEFLLINHPLDCPICDQGGECDLQDQAVAYGRSTSRYDENKRAVEDKYMGPLVKTIMTRCIQCTRCVRFAAEVAGVEEMGMISRGENAEITTYLEKSLTSELSGNVIDLCPVGALTSKPYAFNARPWELRKTSSIDVMDALGASIRIDAKGDAVMRIMPELNEEVNEEWLSDKSRFVWDGLARQRLDKPYIRENGKLRAATWGEAFEAVKAALAVGADKTGVVAGDLIEVEQAKAALDFFRALGVKNTDCRPAGAEYGTSGVREQYILNPTLMGVEEADALLLIGANPRVEAAVWNARIRKSWLWGDLKVGMIGEAADLTYEYAHLGTSAADLDKLASTDFYKVLKDAKRPMIVIGESALCGPGSAELYAKVHKLAQDVSAVVENWAGLGVLHTAAGRVGALDVGFVPAEGGLATAGILGGDLSTVFLLGADEVDLSKLGNSTVIYVGSHGDAGASRADIVLPSAAYTEMTATYVNTEGRVQMTSRAVQPKGEAREGWAIFRALSGVCGKALPYDTADQLRAALRGKEGENTVFSGRGYAPGARGVAALSQAVSGGSGALSDTPFASPVVDFYLTNPVARASKTMAECSALASRLDTPVAAE
ncbi:NADH-quinone oxidoreductase subunit NuoG [Hyphomonas sp. WL0036]|uniref:NADH-quinone oxidoreductase subunit NuoG n=1 Tax=Hyphomonas sediminis TaxID=2866160 RepID=UPI001C7F49EC|nr:NADH-quinone oxidoreductase subunit NuoG [Hyphomonas sediminis]MBY9067556.1 NADH-quinone oxidoreductase subunit NuoG [Hyphomonas sediminis]